MPIKQVLTEQRVPVKIWTDGVDDTFGYLNSHLAKWRII